MMQKLVINMIVSSPSNDMGVSEVVGFALLIGLSLVVASTAVVLGADSVDSFITQSGDAKAENAFANFSSDVNQVGLGSEYSSKTIPMSLEASGTDSFGVSNESSIKIEVEDEDGSIDTVVDETIGYVQYSNDETTMTFENGGVWKGDGEEARLVSPPEFHYQQNTLTLPLITSDQTDTLSTDSVRVTQENRSFTSEQLVIDNDTVFITIESPVYRGWGQYFDEQIVGDTNTQYDDENNTVRIELGLSDMATAQYNAAVTGIGDVNVSGTISGPVESTGSVSGEENVSGSVTEDMESNYRNINTEVESQVTSLTQDGEEVESGDELTAGEYYVNDNFELYDTEIDVSDGNVFIGVPGDVTVSGATEVHLTGQDEEDSGVFRIYSEGDVNFGTGSGNSEINRDGGAENFQIFGTDSMDVRISNNTYYEGIIFAPREDMSESGPQDISGNGAGCNNTNAESCLGVNSELNGAMIAGSTDIRSNATMVYDEDLSGLEMDVTEGENRPELVYLHVSINEIRYE